MLTVWLHGVADGAPVRWSILIATQGKRQQKFAALLDSVMPQVEAANSHAWGQRCGSKDLCRSPRACREWTMGSCVAVLDPAQVEVVALWNNGEKPLGHYRQALLEAAKGDYVSFVDDDDQLSPLFVASILPLLDGVDYVGWRMQCYISGIKQRPTYHSLKYGGWSDDKRGYYRDLSHLNPIKRELALLVDYRTVGFPDDLNWVDRMRELGVVKTEHVVKDPMYFYMYDPRDTVQATIQPRRRRGGRVSRREALAMAEAKQSKGTYTRPEVSWPGFRWVE